VTLRPATLDDIPLLDRWDHEPHVISASSDDPNAAKAFGDLYWPDELAKQGEFYEYFIAELSESNGSKRPIGAMQVMDPHNEETHYWGDVEPNLRAVDIWIGSASDHGKGYGEQMMRLALKRCFAPPEVTAVIIDPLKSNTRAHKFYRRLGFVPTHVQSFLEEDECLVHRLTRAQWRATFPQDSKTGD
jgi:aminoglycoside 6'-N-acetyltransferase